MEEDVVGEAIVDHVHAQCHLEGKETMGMTQEKVWIMEGTENLNL